MSVSFRRGVALCVAVIALTARVAFGQGAPISQASWTLHGFDSQETEFVDNAASNAFDGNPNSFWATQWSSAAPPPPHEIQINLGAVYAVNGFRYLPRQDGFSHGRIAQYEFYVSMDGATWGTAVASGTFPDTAVEKEVVFTAKTGRYIRLRALSEVLGRPWTTVAELNVLGTGGTPPPPPISQGGWTLFSVDSQETQAANNAAGNAFDGNPNSFWATQWSSAAPPPPHEIQINLGAVYAVSGFRYLPRQDGFSHGRIAQYEFYVSTDGATWGTAVASGTFPDTAVEKEVVFTAKTGRYIRLRALSEVLGRPWTTVAELNVLGSGNQPPNGTITSPTSDATIAPGQSVTFNGSGSDPDNNLPLTYAWNFGAGGPASSTSQNPGAVVFPTAGVYTVSFTVRDSLGAPDPTPATRTVTVQSTSPTSASLIPQTSWSVRFVDSEELVYADFSAPHAFDGSASTAWTSAWFNGGPPPPHEIQVDLGASYNVTGFRYLPYSVWQAGRVGDYEFYVSADGTNWGSPVASGSFPDVNVAAPRDVMFLPKMGRFVRLRALSEVNGGPVILSAIAELNVWRAGTGGNQAPTVSIISPAANTTIPARGALKLEGTASDPEGNLPLVYRWSIGPGSGIPDSTVLDPGFVHFDRPGTYPVTISVSDGLGATTSVTRTVSVVGPQPLPTTGWALRFVDSQETDGANNAATNAFDGNPGTFWATQWGAAQPLPPHELQIDLGGTRDVSGFRYVPRQDGFSYGNIKEYLFYVSTDGVNWGNAVAAGRFGDDASTKEVLFATQSGRYVRLKALSEVSGLPYTVVAELQVLQRQCVTPSVFLTQPRSGHLQGSATLPLRAEACVSQSGQGVRFSVDGATVGTDFSAPYEITPPALSADEHVVEAVLVTSGGNPVVGSATQDVATPVGVGRLYVAMGDGITGGNGDDIATDDNSADLRSRMGGFTPILGDALTNARPYPVAVANEGVAGAGSATGAVSVEMLLQKYPGSTHFLIMYGHNDYWAGTPSGLGLSPGSAGYEGSFKQNMQQIINAVRAAGKVALLSKHSAAFPLDSPMNMAIQQYNLVIDELYANPANGISAVPPDFYTYFSSRRATHYWNDVEMNGLGYQSMAQLWLNAILAAP